MADVVTVDYLLNFLEWLKKDGRGDMKIKCKDNFLHEDEIFVNYEEKEVRLDGYLFHIDTVGAVSKFCENMEKAKKDFYKELNKQQKLNKQPEVSK